MVALSVSFAFSQMTDVKKKMLLKLKSFVTCISN